MATTPLSSYEIWSHPGRPLIDHLLDVAERAKEAVRSAAVGDRTLQPALIEELAYIVAACHDLGKATRFFQEYLRETDPSKKSLLKSKPETHHALLSAFLALPWLEQSISSHHVEEPLKSLITAVAFEAIRRHHGNLATILQELSFESSQLELIKAQWATVDANAINLLLQSVGHPLDHTKLSAFLGEPKRHLWQIKARVREYLDSVERQGCPEADTDLFFISELLFSVLLDADKKSVVQVPRGYPPRADLRSTSVDEYRKAKGWANDSGSNFVMQLRNRLYLEVESNLESALDQRILTLTAPTGSGKTLTALNFALKLRGELQRREGYCPRIIYCLPFLSIIDQNFKVFKDVLQTATNSDTPENLLLAHHHLSDTTYRAHSGDEFDSDVASLLIEGWESEIVVTTFMQLFFTLVGNRNRPLRRFHRLARAIVILDEVQCFPHYYWLLFRRAAQAMAETHGTVFVLMTATQPLIFSRDMAHELVPDHSRYYRALKRVQVSLHLAEPCTLSDLALLAARDVNSNPDKSFLFVMNTVRAAQNFHRELSQLLQVPPEEIYFMSSHVVPKERLQRIDRLRSKSKRWVAVTTQLVEAGVDIDADVVYRDFGPLDSLMQVSGRCNRNFLSSQGRVELFNLIDDNRRPFCEYIYDRFLLEKTRQALRSAATLEEPEFLTAANNYYSLVAEGQSQDASRSYLCAMARLDFDTIADFRLIEEMPEVDVFVEVDEEATKVWQQFEEIMQLRDFSQRRQAYARIRPDLHRYLVSVSQRWYSEAQIPEQYGIGYVGREIISKYYDPLTGLKSQAGSADLW